MAYRGTAFGAGIHRSCRTLKRLIRSGKTASGPEDQASQIELPVQACDFGRQIITLNARDPVKNDLKRRKINKPAEESGRSCPSPPLCLHTGSEMDVLNSQEQLRRFFRILFFHRARRSRVLTSMVRVGPGYTIGTSVR